MISFLRRIGKSAYPHRWRFLIVWLLLIAGMGTAAAMLYNGTSENFTFPGFESVETQKEIQQCFATDEDQLLAPTGTVVIKAPEGKTLDDPAVIGEVNKLVAAMRGSEGPTKTGGIMPPIMAAEGMKQQAVPAMRAQGYPEEQISSNLKAVSPLSTSKTAGTISVIFDAATDMDIGSRVRNAFTATVEKYKGNLDVAWLGNAFQMGGVSATAEVIDTIVAAFVLIVTFGNFVAAGLPLLSAVTGLDIGMAGIFAATTFTDTISTMAPTLASMIGLAVGIDYALFILARFRNELVTHVNASNLEPKDLAAELRKIPHDERAHSAGLTVGKAGSVVVFAGLTALVALVTLSIINILFLTVMALAATFTVATAVLVAITLLPAILGPFGTRVFAGRVPSVKAPDPENDTPTMGLKWVRITHERPLAFILGTAVVLILLAIPAADLRLAMPPDGMVARGSPDHTAYEMTESAFDLDRNSPMSALVDYKGPAALEKQNAMMTALTELQSVDGAVNAQVTATNGNPQDPRDLGGAAQILITPAYSATDEHAADLLQFIRNTRDKYSEATDVRYSITGISPTYRDISQGLSDVLLPYAGIVLVLAFLLLMLVLRSIWVPLAAMIGLALSVAATFDVTVAPWQEGALGIIDDPQPLISFLPIILTDTVFGLVIDYQVLLVTCMREGWTHGKTTESATANGFKHGARMVTAAALIMILMFATFILMDEPFIKIMGFALAATVLFDAFIVRMTFIPAMVLPLGERIWKIPGQSDKTIPAMDVEGESLNKQFGNAGTVANTEAAEAKQHQLDSHKSHTDSDLEGVGAGLLRSITQADGDSAVYLNRRNTTLT